MYAQYNLADTSPAQIQATTNNSVDAGALAAAGRGEISVPDDTDSAAFAIDTSGSPTLVAKIAAVYSIGSTSTMTASGTLTVDGDIDIDGTLEVTG